jgi:hypothetical protein
VNSNAKSLLVMKMTETRLAVLAMLSILKLLSWLLTLLVLFLLASRKLNNNPHFWKFSTPFNTKNKLVLKNNAALANNKPINFFFL